MRRRRSPTTTWARRRSTASPSVGLATAPPPPVPRLTPTPTPTLTPTLISPPPLTPTAALGGKTMVPVLFSKIQEMFKSADWKQRHAALMAISQSGEGCCRAS